MLWREGNKVSRNKAKHVCEQEGDRCNSDMKEESQSGRVEMWSRRIVAIMDDGC